MLLRDFLNEFELDWAQAPSRSGQIQGKKLAGARVLLVGQAKELQEAIAWSFMAWNDAKKAGICAAEAELLQNQGAGAGQAKKEKRKKRGKIIQFRSVPEPEEEDSVVPESSTPEPQLVSTYRFTEEGFAAEDADYVILTGLCQQEIPASASGCLDYLENFRRIVCAAARTKCRRVLLLSDGRVYGRTEREFAVSEYEAGQAFQSEREYAAQCMLQAMEGILAATLRAQGKPYGILRPGLIYGPCLPTLSHAANTLAGEVAKGRAFSVSPSPDRSSYLCIHDLLTAVQFVLTECPENKIFNGKSRDSDKSEAELAVLLFQNFPGQCRMSMDCTRAAQEEDAEGVQGGRASDSLLLNTQLLEHYGFQPQISMEDGLIMLVKSLQNTGEVFIFDNTYLGKLSKVQQILLGYLLEIDRICRKYDIKYFLAGGTLLGAIRHHGFIPWDDDADVMMLREDYDRFLEVAPKELPEHIFLQLPTTEKGNYNPFTKLRINNTMFATEFTGHFMEMHNGIFFDILSHDQTGSHRWSQKLHLMLTMLLRSIVFNKWGDTDIQGGGAHPVICRIVDKVKYLVPMRFAVWAQNRSLEFFRGKESEYLYDGMGRNLSRGAFPKKWLEEAVYVDFEGYQFPVPREYDKYLTYLYGDYMQMIPVSQRRTSHSIVLTDLGAYSDYRLGQQGNGRQ